MRLKAVVGVAVVFFSAYTSFAQASGVSVALKGGMPMMDLDGFGWTGWKCSN